MGSIGLGATAKLYYSVGGFWVEISNCRDLNLDIDSGNPDVTPRENEGWKGTTYGWTDASVDFEMVWDTNDAAMIAIREAWMNDTEIEMAVMDDIITALGTEGLHASFVVNKFKRKEPLAEAIMVEVSLKPGLDKVPEWMVI